MPQAPKLVLTQLVTQVQASRNMRLIVQAMQVADTRYLIQVMQATRP